MHWLGITRNFRDAELMYNSIWHDQEQSNSVLHLNVMLNHQHVILADTSECKSQSASSAYDKQSSPCLASEDKDAEGKGGLGLGWGGGGKERCQPGEVLQSKFAALSGGPSLISTSTSPLLLLSGGDAIAKKPGLLSPTLICTNWPAVLYPSAKLPRSMTSFLSCNKKAML